MTAPNAPREPEREQELTRAGMSSLSAVAAERPMLRNFAWSLVLHLLILVVVAVFSVERRDDLRPITVLLAGDASEGIGAGSQASSQFKSHKASKVKGNLRSSRASTANIDAVPGPDKPPMPLPQTRLPLLPS